MGPVEAIIHAVSGKIGPVSYLNLNYDNIDWVPLLFTLDTMMLGPVQSEKPVNKQAGK